jgi:hypothetical protein
MSALKRTGRTLLDENAALTSDLAGLLAENERLRGLLREATEALEPFYEAKTVLADDEAIRARDALTNLKYEYHEYRRAALKSNGEGA